jgi:hypothetical protein
VTGVFLRPRATMAEVARNPTFAVAWAALLVVLALCGWALLSTAVGRQALVDERVRVVEGLGGQVDNPTYAALQARPPWAGYLTSGGRLLLTPGLTLAVGAGLMALAGRGRPRLTYRVALAITVHASAVLALQQVVATPLHYLRESLTSPTTLAGVLPMIEDGTAAARMFGSIDLFGLWWIWLLAVGLSAATGRPARQFLWRLLLVYASIAALVATVFAVAGA